MRYDTIRIFKRIFVCFNIFRAGDEDDDIINRLTSRSATSSSKSLIARLAERRKAAKSVYCFTPAGISQAAPRAPVASCSSSNNNSSTGGGADLLGSILASQSQLKQFGKSCFSSSSSACSAPPPRPRHCFSSSNSRVLGAILASQATLSRLGKSTALVMTMTIRSIALIVGILF